MANRSKQKGTAAETALLRWLEVEFGGRARRSPPSGSKDVGDLMLISMYREDQVVIEVKDMVDKARAINEGLAELEVEMANAGTNHGVLVIKRKGKTDPAEWLAIRKVCNDPEIGRP